MKLLMENWRGYLAEAKKSSKAAAMIGDVLGSAKYDGSAHKKGFENILDEDETSDDINSMLRKIRPSVISQVIKKHSKGMNDTTIDMSLVKDPVELAILNSIFLFTAGNVATVRNPEKFDPQASEKGVESPSRGGFAYGNRVATYTSSKKGDGPEETTFGGSGLGIYRYLLKPTKKLYTIANRVIRIMASMKNPAGSTTIYRGIGLPYEVFENLKEGEVFHAGGAPRKVSSWTTDPNVAEQFECGGVAGNTIDSVTANNDKKWVCTTFIIENCKIGVFMGELSGFRGESEFLLSAPVYISKIVMEKDISDWIDKPEGTRFMAKVYCRESAGYQTETFFEAQK